MSDCGRRRTRPVRHISLRSAVAAGPRDSDVHCALLSVEPTSWWRKELVLVWALISLLFMTSVMFPLFMPDGVNIDKLLRAQIAFVLYAGAYLAEVVRGGLQAVPGGSTRPPMRSASRTGRKTA
jgi:ABC-type amino acid transport system permease subunit